MRTEPWPQLTYTENLVVRTCGFRDMGADRHTDTLIAILRTPARTKSKYDGKIDCNSPKISEI